MPQDNYEVLARKWRPLSLSEIVGQEPIVRIFTNALRDQRIHHAYLLTGTRGVGKTTFARILAKCLSCESGTTPTPCGTCHACTGIDAGQFLDVYEVDAASRTKVEDTKELLDKITYPPSVGRYKIYIIDEVHMLSTHSFNALLKTLEEPPAHVKFILATTDPKRLPITILSRCLQFQLKHITPTAIREHLAHICATDGMRYDMPALEKLAEAARGSMRDALSLLEQALAYGSGKVDTADVHAMLGSVSQETLLPLISALAAQDGAQLFQEMTQLSACTTDFEEVLNELIHLFHQTAIAQVAPEAAIHSTTAVALAKAISPEDIQIYYQIALLAKRDFAFSASPQQAFEMAMLRMLAFKIPATVQDTAHPAVKASPMTAPKASPPTPTQPTPPPPVAEGNWRKIMAALNLTGMALALASNCTLVKQEEDRIELALSATHQPMLNQKLKERIREALNDYFKKTIQLEINISTAALITPLKEQQQEQNQQLTQAKQEALQNPHIQQLINMYDATIDVSLLT
ncbi:MAG TPA: DNA polymerase III subunit gamma/tau [Gammaproteobacteria bacterium]|jgi:DNA polymerase-3 subunit gamma/tau|nr:DNA polymerase III subunit gamma/tau [Gammaproteobacteria bacterium]